MLQLKANFGLVLLLALVPAASASTITFGTGGDTGFTTGGVTSFTVNNAVGQNGLNVTVTAGTTTTCSPSCLITSVAGGFGVSSSTGDAPEVDGSSNSPLDTLTIAFNNSVRVTSITFSSWENNDDAGIYNGGSLVTTYSNGAVPTATLNMVGTSFQIRTTGSNDEYFIQSITFTEVPEPATFALMGAALAGLGISARKRVKRG